MGEKLKEARLRLGYSEKEASEETRIPVSVLAAFEADDFSRVGAHVYASGFLKRYCLFLGLDVSPFLSEFRAAAIPAEKPAVFRMAHIRFFPFRLRGAVFIATGLALLLLTGYVSVNLVAAYSAPRISFFDGAGDKAISERIFVFSGRTHPEADLTMNGRVVYLNESGEFEERVLLAQGLNAFEFVAKNKFGKVNKAKRHIFVK